MWKLEISKSGQQKGKYPPPSKKGNERNMKRVTRDLWEYNKGFVPSETQKEKMKRAGTGKVCKKYGKKISESGKRNKPTYPKTE